MNPVRELETQCSHAEFLQSLPRAFDNRPYEIIENDIIVYDGDRKILIRVHDEPVRHLGSLELPVEKLRFEFVDYSEEQADDMMATYRQHTFRAGGG